MVLRTDAIAELNLTSEQKSQIRSIEQSVREQANSVFTDEQRRELRQEMRSHSQKVRLVAQKPR